MVIIENEIYLSLDDNDWEKTGYFTFLKNETSDDVTYIPHTKFAKKVFLFKQLFFASGLTVNREIYRTKNLSKVEANLKRRIYFENLIARTG